MKICKLCNKEFPIWMRVEGKDRNLNNRKYCLDCSPFNSHNTKPLSNIQIKNKELKDVDCKCCSMCREEKSISEFYMDSSLKVSSHCKMCFNIKQKNRQKEIKKQAVEYLGGKCYDCGEVYPPFVYDFHHLNPDLKSYSISKSATKVFKNLKEELDKCVLLCANCHRFRHWD